MFVMLINSASPLTRCDTDDESLFEEDQTTFEEVLEIREEAV